MKNSHIIKFLWLISLALLLLGSPSGAVDFGRCIKCHETSISDEMMQTYLHSPFREQRCAKCHAANEIQSASVKPRKAPKRIEDRKKINWLGESTFVDVNHSFIFPAAKLGNSLIIEARGDAHRYMRKEIEVPSLSNLEAYEDRGDPPALYDVHVLSVERGILLSATIGLKTDTLTRALVRYGTEELSQTARAGNRLGKNHQVALHDLKLDRTYRVSVVAEDLFGREQHSQSLTFSTAKSSPGVNREPKGSDRQNDDPIQVKSRFKRLKDKYLVELTLSDPAVVFIGSRPPSRNVRAARVQNQSQEEFHQGLSTQRSASLEACGQCHKGPATTTHPVNVFAKPGMTIPPEYPTLPDGRITCISCHEAHGSDHEYLTRKPSKRELCTGCHKDML